MSNGIDISDSEFEGIPAWCETLSIEMPPPVRSDMHHSQLIFVTRRIVKAPSFCGGLQDLATATCEEAVGAHRMKEKDVSVRPLPSETPPTCGLVRVRGHLQEFSGRVPRPNKPKETEFPASYSNWSWLIVVHKKDLTLQTKVRRLPLSGWDLCSPCCGMGGPNHFCETKARACQAKWPNVLWTYRLYR